MKIISLHVKSFGKLANVKLEFQNGVNVISNVNGFGKTTMANFIRAMLYGFTYSRAGGATDASRFATWGSNEKFGGSMIVENNGETYRIERFFGKQAKSEELMLTNVKTNKRIELNCEVGEFLLGVTADSFDRSAYFPQEAVELATNDKLEARLANIVENSAEDYEKIQKNIRDYRKNLKLERGNGGQIYQMDCQASLLEQQLYAAKSAEKRGEDIECRMARIAVEKQRLEQVQINNKKSLDQKQRQNAAQNSLTETDKANADKLDSLEVKLSRIPSEIETDKQRCDELTARISKVRNDVKSRVYPNYLTLVISVILAAVGIALCIALRNVTGYVAGGILIASGIAGVIVAFVKKGAKTLPSGERDALISEYYAVIRKYVYVDDLVYDEAAKRFWDFYTEYQADKREAETLRKTVRRPSERNDQLENEINILQRDIDDAVSAYSALAREEGELSHEIKTLDYDVVTPQEKLDELQIERKQAMRCYEIAGIVSELLAQAKENLSSSYLPRLCARCQELLAQVTRCNLEVAIDRSFNVEIRENGQTKSMSSFSRGIREITLLCFRLALSELLYGKQIPFIIIDDAFVNFDENNFVRATDLLKNVAEYGQVIYFTCHDRTGNLLK